MLSLWKAWKSLIVNFKYTEKFKKICQFYLFNFGDFEISFCKCCEISVEQIVNQLGKSHMKQNDLQK